MTTFDWIIILLAGTMFARGLKAIPKVSTLVYEHQQDEAMHKIFRDWAIYVGVPLLFVAWRVLG